MSARDRKETSRIPTGGAESARTAGGRLRVARWQAGAHSDRRSSDQSPRSCRVADASFRVRAQTGRTPRGVFGGQWRNWAMRLPCGRARAAVASSWDRVGASWIELLLMCQRLRPSVLSIRISPQVRLDLAESQVKVGADKPRWPAVRLVIQVNARSVEGCP